MKPMAQPQARPKKTTRRSRRTPAILGTAFVLIALATAVAAFIFVKNLVASWTMTDIGGVNISAGEGSDNPQVVGTVPPGPLQSEIGPTPQPWDGNSRVTILMMGLDFRDWENDQGPAHTDTMILLTIDPLSRTGGMMSIPRDMWVNVPGYGYYKINTAYFIGERDQLPGGGPGMAIRTVEEFLGVPINYYAQVDFNAFTEFVDAIGGVEIDVPYEIVVDPIGEANTLTLPPGRQLIYGSVALGYARNRHTDGNDFDRASRTQQVIMAIRDKVINLNMLPTLITKAPALYQQLSAGIHTNLSLDEVIKLALLAQQIPGENIKQVVIGPDEVANGTSPDGLSILKPITDKIRIKRDELFTSAGPLSPVAATSSDTDLVKAEAARVQIQNGTYVPGLGGRTTEYLATLGVTTVEATNASEVLDLTTIYDYSGKPYTLSYLVSLLNINENRIFNRYDPNSEVDIVIVVGNDWANSNSMP